MIFGIILEEKNMSIPQFTTWKYSWNRSIFKSQKVFSMNLFSIPSLTWKEIYSLSCNPPSPSDYCKGRCGMFLKVDLSKKIAVWLHIGSTYDSVLIRNLKKCGFTTTKSTLPPQKKRILGEKIYVGFCRQSCSFFHPTSSEVNDGILPGVRDTWWAEILFWSTLRGW